jgi:hypothetical protein
LAIGERTSPGAVTCIQATPLPPQPRANSTRPSKSLRENSMAPGTAKPRTTPPPSITPLKALNAVSRRASVTSAISQPKRVSGLSEA